MKNFLLILIFINCLALWAMQMELTEKEKNLLFYAQKNVVEKVQELIQQKTNITVRNHTTPLINALHNKNRIIVELLLENGADVHLPTTEGKTPLIESVRWENDPSIVELLLKKGARVNDVDPLGESALSEVFC